MGRRDSSKGSRRSSRSWDRDLDDLFDWDDFEEQFRQWGAWPGMRRRVIADASRKPDTSLPIGLGILGILFAIMVGGGPLLFLLGFVAVTVGVWRFTWRLFHGMGQLAQRTLQRAFETQQERQKRRLNELDEKLRAAGDSRSLALLYRLAEINQTLESDISQGKLTITAADLLKSVEKAFQVCIENLELACRLGAEAQDRGYDGLPELRQREELIQEVEESVAQLEQIVGQLRERTVGRRKSELKRMREELDESFRIAKRVEEWTEGLEHPSPSYENKESPQP